MSTPSCGECRHSKSPGKDSPNVWCGVTGEPIGRLNLNKSEQERLNEQLAAQCGAFDDMSHTEVTVRPRTVVAAPLPDALVFRTDESEKPNSCVNCVNYAHPQIAKEDLGFAGHFCAAFGEVMSTSTNLHDRANECPVGKQGTNRQTLDGVVELIDKFRLPGTGGAFVAMQAQSKVKAATENPHRVDPRQYATDAPVSVADHANFIRAWRAVKDPTGKRPDIILPIFDGERLCGFDPRTTYGRHRPDLYVDHANLLWDFAVDLFELEETPILIGPAGGGKTEFVAYLAWLLDLPFTRISVSKKTEMWQLWGQSELNAREFTETMADGSIKTVVKNVSEFRLGTFLAALRRFGVILVDEPNLRADFFEAARPIFDNARQIVADEDLGLNIEPTDKTFVVLAMNPPWDPAYIGTEPLNVADTSRISPRYLDFPSPDIEREIIREHCIADGGYDIPEKLLDKVMQVSTDIRESIAGNQVPIAWGIRDNVKVARKTRFYDLPMAYRRAVVDGMEPMAGMIIMDFVSGITR